MSLLWLYFIFAERLTVWYGNEPSEMATFWSIQRGRFAVLFWTMVCCNFLIPFPILAIKKLRTIAGTVIASFTIVIGMWLERFLIVVPPLEHKYLPYDWGSYSPTWVEISITVGTCMGMILLYVLFAKFVPIISIWELKGPEHTRPFAEQANATINAASLLLDGTPSTNS
jgi:molybdopterin-containing oxidoreductase family membrane subunit